MVNHSGQGMLTRLRRYHRRLIFGGGAVITAVLVGAFFLGMVSTVHHQLMREYRELSLDLGRIGATQARAIVQQVQAGQAVKATQEAQEGAFALFDTWFPVPHFDGTFLLVDDALRLVQTGSRLGVDEALVQRVLASGVVAAAQQGVSDAFRAGVFTLAVPLADTGWFVIYAQPWRQAVSNVMAPFVTAAVTTLGIVGLMWLLLVLFNRHVFAPMFERSARLFEGEHLSSTMIDTAPVGLGLISLSTCKPLRCSPSMTLWLEQAADGPAWWIADLVEKYTRRSSPGGAVCELAMTLATRDGGAVDLSVRMAPARYRGEAVLVVAMTDVTARKRLEKDLLAARLAADAANASKSAFLAAMSHEIRTPLHAILGNLELLSHSALAPLVQARVATVSAASEQLMRIIADVLDFSKIEAGEMTIENECFDVVPIVEKSLALFAPMAHAKGLTLLSRFETDHIVVAQVVGDATRLSQVLSNLLSNAVKFTSEGTVTLHIEIAEQWLALHVEDTGIGISEEAQTRVFGLFSQADPSIHRQYGGTGLGLALCRRLVDAMGGSLSMRSRLGSGTRCTVKLALAGSAMPHQGPATAPFSGEVVALVAQQGQSGERLVSRSVSHAASQTLFHTTAQLEAWGLVVLPCRDAASLNDAAYTRVRVVIVIGDRAAALTRDATSHVASGGWIIDCHAQGPLQPVREGRTVHVSSYSPRALLAALKFVLHAQQWDVVGAESLPSATQSGVSRTARPLRVLIAEDCKANGVLLAEQLATLGHGSTLVGDGGAALDALSRASFDLVITDIGMPHIDGYVLARSIRSQWPTIPVVALTAHATQEEHRRCEAAGMHKVLTKPLSLTGLRTLVASIGTDAIARATHPAHPAHAAHPTHPAHPASWRGGELPPHVREVFLAGTRQTVDDIQAAFDAGDIRRLREQLHAVKGVLGAFSQPTLAKRAADIDQCVGEGGVHALASTSALLREFIGGVRRLLDATQGAAHESDGHGDHPARAQPRVCQNGATGRVK
ncbi:hybrid sensor histidine kinase/response regulator [Pandoraea pneumonica]|nr:hybrid sensor histidine kinase/response regulator [Pandoraea pneumonica]